ncbi:MAG: carbamoyltransferase HypF [Lachnospiraceae bacterium]|nr:carbamoyltransferase HypF [Lachnospiraceae bacterium]
MNFEIIIKGLVQGVGFRPWVYRLAKAKGLSGDVRNSGGIVRVRILDTDEDAVKRFVSELKNKKPKEAIIESVEIKPAERTDTSAGFFIISSDDIRQGELADIPADIGVCSKCISEMKDMANRRYSYPYISCVSCGPRYSIMNRLPYDRENTTMSVYDMCPDCALDYEDEANPYARRHYAQTISCGACGPQPILRTENGQEITGAPAIKKASDILQYGGILAIKGIGGYQFACVPEDTYAVLKLRDIKGREKKPFALLFPTVASIREVAAVSKEEEKLLRSGARPIVLLDAHLKDKALKFVCGDSRSIGAMLPQTGIHEMLANILGPLVLTSGNISGEPLSYKDEDFFRHEFEGIEGVLYYKRDILTPLDDSVTRVLGGKVQVMRRARGYVPDKLRLDRSFKKPLLTFGADLKAAFAIAKGQGLILSQYIGDLESYACQENYKETIRREMELYGFRPEAIACDKHPGYISGRLAKEYSGKYRVPLIGIYHHHAHIASVMAEHGLTHTIGVALDGTGYGKDDKIWGGEIFYISGSNADRRAHLNYFKLIGGDGAAKDAEKDLKCLMHSAGFEIDDQLVAAAIDEGINTFETSSAGRFFDITAAALGIRSYNTYEAECAIALENAARYALRHGLTTYALPVTGDPHELIYYIIKAKQKGMDVRELALGFHRSIASWIIKECEAIRDDKADNNVCLSGGCFANQVLSEMCRIGLTTKGFHVYMNERIPMNDQGIAVGQAYILALQ